MAELWHLPEVNQWWLPNDEGRTNINRIIRSFIEERTVQPRDNTGEDLRDMKAIFSKLNIEDTGSHGSSPSQGSGSVHAEVSPPQALQTPPIGYEAQLGYGRGDEYTTQFQGVVDTQAQSEVQYPSDEHGGDRMSGLWEAGFMGP